MKKFLFYICMVILSWVCSLRVQYADWDLWARLAVGKIYFQIGHVLKTDIFSYTPTKPVWIDHEWGSGVVFYFLIHYFGDTGLLVLKIAVTFLILFLISKIIELQSTKKDDHLNLLFYYLVLVGMFYGICDTVRCQLFTFILFTLWIYILERIRRGENRLLWIFPATSLIWANLHGGFISGLGLLLIYGIGEFLNKKPFWKYFLILIPSALITVFNPYGVKYWGFIISAVAMNRMVISEWQPTSLFPLNKWRSFKVFTLIMLSSFIFGLFKRSNKFLLKKFDELDKVKCLLLALTLYLAISYNKHQALFAISAGCFLYYDFNNLLKLILEKVKVLSLFKSTFAYALIIVFSVVFILTQPFRIMADPSKFPVGSVEFVKQNHLSGNVLSVFEWGSYIAWKLYPDNFIAEDGRYEEVYPEYINLMVYNFNNRVNDLWLTILDKYHTDIIIMQKRNTDSYQGMLKNRSWKEVYSDKISAVFVPVSKARKAYIIPLITSDITVKNKYETNIDFFR